MQSDQQNQDRLSIIIELLSEHAEDEAGEALNSLHPAEIAHVLESLPPENRNIAWELVSPDKDGDVLLYVKDEVREGLIRSMDKEELLAATETLDTDDLADIISDLPKPVIQDLLKSMDEQNRKRLESVLQYPEDTAGGLMNVDVVTVRPDVNLDVVLRYVRYLGKLPDMTDSLYVVNREGRYLGILHITDLITQSDSLEVADVMKHDIEPIPASAPESEVANRFEKLDLVTAPVVDENLTLLGRITIDDVVDVIREEADRSFLSQAGLDEDDDIFSPVVRSSRRRAVWLGINLVTALMAAWVIGLFGATIEKLVALAVLMPVVASMGGIAGGQTLTLVIRGVALGRINPANAPSLLKKEMAIGALNGAVWSVIIGYLAALWFDSSQLGIVIGLAIIVNLFVAAFAGATLPLGLRRIGIDPALSGNVILTTVTDVVGFFVFLGLASLFLV